MTNENKFLIQYLKDMIEQLEQNTMSSKDRLRLKHFYYDTLIQPHIARNIDKEDVPSDEDMKRFLFLGWYMYNCLEEGHQVES